MRRAPRSGSLALVTATPRAYLPEEIRLAETFASFAAIALANLHRMELQQQLVDRLQGLNDLRRDLVASVSHELRTPLTCIVGFAGHARRALGPARRRGAARRWSTRSRSTPTS